MQVPQPQPIQRGNVDSRMPDHGQDDSSSESSLFGSSTASPLPPEQEEVQTRLPPVTATRRSSGPAKKRAASEVESSEQPRPSTRKAARRSASPKSGGSKDFGWLPKAKAVPGQDRASLQQKHDAHEQAAVLRRNPTYAKQEVIDSMCLLLQVKVDIVHYDLRPATANGYEDVAAALWARFKCRSLAYRDWALRMAIQLSEPNQLTEGEVFAKASVLLDEWEEGDDIRTADETVRGGRPMRPWVPTVVSVLRQYAIGDRSGATHLRILNRPLQERYNSGGYEDSHLSYLVGDGDRLYEHEVPADGYCWLRSVLMQLPQSNHGKKSWHADTGSLQSHSRTSKTTKLIPVHTKKGVQALQALNKEAEAVARETAEFITLNPKLFAEALDRATSGTNVADSEPLQPGRVQYEFRDAIKLNSIAEDYVMPSHPARGPWLSRLNAEFRWTPRAAMVLVICWTTSYEAAATLLRSYEAGDWALAQKLGMVVKRGDRRPMTIRAYVSEVLPGQESQQAMVTI